MEDLSYSELSCHRSVSIESSHGQQATGNVGLPTISPDSPW